MDQREQLRRMRELVGAPSVEVAAATGIDRTRLSFYWNARLNLAPEEVQRVADFLCARVNERHQQLAELREGMEHVATQALA